MMKLINVVDHHGIWREADTWNNIIKDEIQRAYLQGNNEKRISEKSSNSKHKKVSLEMMVEKLPRLTKVKILQMVTDYSIMLKLKSTIVIDLLAKWTNTFKLEHKHLRDFIIDIKTFQPIQTQCKDKNSIAFKNRKKTIEKNKYGCKEIMIIGKSIKYISDPKDLLVLILLSKKISRILKEDVHRQVIRRANFKYMNSQRLQLWKLILGYVLT